MCSTLCVEIAKLFAAITDYKSLRKMSISLKQDRLKLKKKHNIHELAETQLISLDMSKVSR